MRFLYDRRKRGIYMRRIVHHWNTSTYLYSRVFFSFSLCLSSFVSFLFEEWRERRIEESREFEKKFWREINLILFI